MNNPQEQILKLLSRIETIINAGPQDLVWSNFNSIEEVNLFLKEVKEQASKSDKGVIPKIIYLCAPTGNFQEISISSGWGYEFCQIANELEEAIDLWKKE